MLRKNKSSQKSKPSIIIFWNMAQIKASNRVRVHTINRSSLKMDLQDLREIKMGKKEGLRDKKKW